MSQQIQLFQHLEINVISTELFSTISFIQLTVFILSLIATTLLSFIVLKKSPKTMKEYKWFILMNTWFGFAFQLITTAFHPFPLLPYSVIVLHGIVDFWICVYGKMVGFLVGVGIFLGLVPLVARFLRFEIN